MEDADVQQVLVSYEYFLNFDREILYIWRRGTSSASALYIIMRYASLAAVVVTMLNLFPFPGKSSAVSFVLACDARLSLTGVRRGKHEAVFRMTAQLSPSLFRCNVITRFDSTIDALVIVSSSGIAIVLRLMPMAT